MTVVAFQASSFLLVLLLSPLSPGHERCDVNRICRAWRYSGIRRVFGSAREEAERWMWGG